MGVAKTQLGLDLLLTRLDRAALKPQQKLPEKILASAFASPPCFQPPT